MTGSASAFPRNCAGTHCSGSKSDSFGNVCTPGAATYWEDSNLPANAIRPHLTSFKVTPHPPCTGATISAPTVEHWPASPKDPNGKPAQPHPGEATFRIRWTVTVPPNSHSLGSMKVDWSIAWTQPSPGSNSTTTTTKTSTGCPTTGKFPPECRYDLDPTIASPDFIDGSKSPQRIDIKVTVLNNGPAWSPALPSTLSDGLSLEVFLPLPPYRLSFAKLPLGCHESSRVTILCPVDALPPGKPQVLTFTVLWTAPDKSGLLAWKRSGKPHSEFFIDIRADVNYARCGDEETECTNNRTKENISPW